MNSLLLFFLFAAQSVSDPGKLQPLEPRFAETPPAIDGKLEDWKTDSLPLGEWLTYNPNYGETMAQKTVVWMAYDKDNLYFAFRCADPEPEKIKTSIARRDTIWNDDWVGLSLDAVGNGQSSYDLFVNPNGIQGDILNTSNRGEDTAPDWVWESAGKITKEGYEVELRVPLKSIRFKSGDDVLMGIVFWRRVSRLGVSASWPDLPRVLTDLLGTWELVPGTVAYAGYGSLYEKCAWDGRALLRGSGDYLNTQRGLFIKLSYLYRF